MSIPLLIIGQAVIYNGNSCLKRWKVKHQRVLRLTLLASALLPINCVLKLDFFKPFEPVVGLICQIANICSELNK